ncbi:MAG: hypothetical protein SGILL_007129 [Bacillariaceae sp.]
MARGKNYLNNGKGLHLQGGKGTGNMKMCEYGSGCTRPGCIYRHDDTGGGENNKKGDGVCVLFLAGKCSFKAKGCRKRHPPPEEVKRLKARYHKIKCRHGDDCFTDSCLYLHPRDVKDQDDPVAFMDPRDFPSLMGNGPSTAPVKPVPNSAWNSAPVGVNNGKPGTGAKERPQNAKSPTRDQQDVPRPPPPTPVSPPQNQEQISVEMPPPQQQLWGAYQAPPMMMPPMPAHPQQQQQYYGNMIVDPNTGYPIDPAYFHQAMMYQQQQQFAPLVGVPMPMEATHFNAEAKEFIPGSSG